MVLPQLQEILNILILNSLLSSLEKEAETFFFLMMYYNTKNPLDYSYSQLTDQGLLICIHHKEFSDEFREKSEDFGLCFYFGDTLLKL